MSDLETYLAAVEERERHAIEARLATTPTGRIAKSQLDVPTLVAMVQRYRRYLSACGPTMCETEVNIIAREAMEKSGG